MKILFIAWHYPYPLADGASMRTFYILKYLANRGHALTLLSFIRPPQTRQHDIYLAPFCQDIQTVWLWHSPIRDLWSLLTSLPRRTPFLIARDHRAEMAGKVHELLANTRPELVYVDHLQMAQYVTSVSSAHLLLDEHNVECQILRGVWETEPWGVKKLVAGLEYLKLRRWELEAIKGFDTILTVTARDREILQEMAPMLGNNTYAIPTSIDLSSFQPVALNNTSKNIVFTGHMSWLPNVDAVLYFYHHILPLVRQKVPEARFYVVGKKPARVLIDLATKQGLCSLF